MSLSQQQREERDASPRTSEAASHQPWQPQAIKLLVIESSWACLVFSAITLATWILGLWGQTLDPRWTGNWLEVATDAVSNSASWAPWFGLWFGRWQRRTGRLQWLLASGLSRRSVAVGIALVALSPVVLGVVLDFGVLLAASLAGTKQASSALAGGAASVGLVHANEALPAAFWTVVAVSLALGGRALGWLVAIVIALGMRNVGAELMEASLESSTAYWLAYVLTGPLPPNGWPRAATPSDVPLAFTHAIAWLIWRAAPAYAALTVAFPWFEAQDIGERDPD